MGGKLLFSPQAPFSASPALFAALRAECGALPHTPAGALPLHPAKGISPFGNPVPRFARVMLSNQDNYNF